MRRHSLTDNSTSKSGSAPLASISELEVGAINADSQRSSRKGSFIPAFSLTKYYLDAVTECGDYFIGYFAKLSFKHLSLGYAETLHSPELHGLKSGPVIGAGSGPVSDGQNITWHHPKLGFEGKWSSLSPPSRNRLLSTPGGCVDWVCLQPSSKVALKTSNGLDIEALGYCEVLNLTIPPWQLGIKELIWGRFVSATQSVVWIEWRGENSLRLVLWNGIPADPVEVSDTRISTREFTVSIEPAKSLRDGYLGTTVFSKIPAVRHLAPIKMLKVHETKQLGRGIIKMCDGRQEEGWVIHETVIWPD